MTSAADTSREKIAPPKKKTIPAWSVVPLTLLALAWRGTLKTLEIIFVIIVAAIFSLGIGAVIFSFLFGFSPSAVLAGATLNATLVYVIATLTITYKDDIVYAYQRERDHFASKVDKINK